MESGSGYLLQVGGRGRDDMDSIGLNSSGAASQGQSSVLQQEGERVRAAAVQRRSKSGSTWIQINLQVYRCQCSFKLNSSHELHLPQCTWHFFLIH